MDTSEEALKAKLSRMALERKIGQDVLSGKWRPTIKVESILTRSIPKGKKHAALRCIVDVFNQQNLKPQNYLLAKCITPTLLNHNKIRRKLGKKDYLAKKEKFDYQIKNKFRTLKKFLKPDSSVKFHSQYSEIIK